MKFQLFGHENRCPKCGSLDVRRSSKQFSDVFYAWFSLFPNRCRNCRSRFFLRKLEARAVTPAAVRECSLQD